MKEEIFFYVIGTAGSGKSTLTSTIKEWMVLNGLDAITVNLDPGAENLPYDPDVDIRDWISLQEVMKTHGLGPNGAQIACADMLALNTADVQKSIAMFKADFILVDTPGQLELFVFREAGKYLIQFLNPGRSMIGYLIDHALARSASGFISQLLLSISTNFRLQQPQINILSKADILTEHEQELIEGWSCDPHLLYDAVIQEDASVYREMSENLLHVLQDFGSFSPLQPTGKDNYRGIEDLYTLIQLSFKGGEDVMKD
jgi:GTPase SAR1 family protein